MNVDLARRHALLPLQVLDGVRLVSLLQVQAIMALCITFMEVRRPNRIEGPLAWCHAPTHPQLVAACMMMRAPRSTARQQCSRVTCIQLPACLSYPMRLRGATCWT